MAVRRSRRAPKRGTDSSSAFEYGWAGAVKIWRTGPASTMRPANMTATRSHGRATTPRSCVTTIIATRWRSWPSSTSPTCDAWIVRPTRVAGERGLATGDPRGRPRDEARGAQARHALARARFAHEPERLGLAERKADAVHRLDRSPAGDDVSPKVANVDAGDQSWRSLGSRVSRSQSPRRLKASTTSRIASPGKSDTHQALVTKSRPSAIIDPQAGVGGGMPAPRNESDASTMMT